MRGGGIGVSRFSVENFFVSECRKISSGKTSVLRLTKLPVAKTPMDNMGGYQDFPSKIFCPTRPKNSVADPSVFHYFHVSENFMLQRVVTIFCRNFFVSQCR